MRHPLPSHTAVGVIVLRAVRTGQAILSLGSLIARQVIRPDGERTHAGHGVDGVGMGMCVSMYMDWEGSCAS